MASSSAPLEALGCAFETFSLRPTRSELCAAFLAGGGSATVLSDALVMGSALSGFAAGGAAASFLGGAAASSFFADVFRSGEGDGAFAAESDLLGAGVGSAGWSATGAGCDDA